MKLASKPKNRERWAFSLPQSEKKAQGKGGGRGKERGKKKDGKGRKGWEVCRKAPQNERKTGKKNETNTSFLFWGHPLKDGGKKMKKRGRENIHWNEGWRAGDEPVKERFAPSNLRPKRELSCILE